MTGYGESIAFSFPSLLAIIKKLKIDKLRGHSAVEMYQLLVWTLKCGFNMFHIAV